MARAGIGKRLLESEFTALQTRQSATSGQAKKKKKKEKKDMSEPTARTRNNEVFPAFCKPTIVTSISIALGVIISMWVQKLSQLCRIASRE
jgi:Na+/glutamate symporter